MKKIFYSIISAAAILTACNQEVIVPQGQGSFSLDLSCKIDYTEMETKALTDEEIINGLSIDIVRPFDGWKVNYTPFSTIRGKVVELGSGSYVLTASSPEKEDAAFDKPIFEGSKGFDIKVGEVTSISLECTISNLKVDVKLSENFVTELSDYTVTVSNGKGILTWVKSATVDDFVPADDKGKTVYMGKKSGYFTVAPITITVDGHRKIDGSTATTSYTITDVAAANNHIICLDAQVIGSLQGITITVSDEVNPIEQPVVVPGFDEKPVEGDKPNEGGDDNTGGDNTGGDNTGDNTGNDNPGGEVEQPVATITWDANPTYADMTINADMNADMVITVPGKIAGFEVTVDSPQLTAAIEGLTSDGSSKMNLITDEGLIAFLSEAAPALPTGTNLSGKTQVDFFLTEFINMISMFGPASGDRHNFTLDIVDEAGKTFTKTLSFVTE